MKLLTSVLALTLCSAVEAAAVAKRSAGCGIQHDFVGSTRGFTVESGGRTRRFNVHLPSNYNAAADTGVVIAYHGKGGDPEGFETAVTRFSDATVNPNLIAVYPAGVNVSFHHDVLTLYRNMSDADASCVEILARTKLCHRRCQRRRIHQRHD
jgi:poly(3-hydroxybutyrate) depolymerase